MFAGHATVCVLQVDVLTKFLEICESMVVMYMPLLDSSQPHHTKHDLSKIHILHHSFVKAWYHTGQHRSISTWLYHLESIAVGADEFSSGDSISANIL